MSHNDGTHLRLSTVCWLDIVHDINVHVAKNDTAFRRAGFPYYIAKYDTCLCRCNLSTR